MPEISTLLGPMAYTDDGSGPSLVFVHGFLFDKTMWAPQIEHFTPLGYRVLCIDMVGFGASTGNAGLIPMSAHTLALTAMLDACGIERAILIGYSMGGQVVLDFLGANPSRATAVVLSDTFAGLDTSEGRAARLALADRLEFEGAHGYSEEFLPLVLSDRSMDNRPDVVTRARAMMAGATASTAAAALRGRAERPDYTGTARTISIPALVIVGAEDHFDRGVLGVELAAAIPGCRFAVVDQAGHTPSMEAPLDFNTAVQRFLDSISDPTEHPALRSISPGG
ncbi:alpha/beta fold hydrolase [Nocardia sp. CA-151230]|uniref:alpha/beta fold hydrolase n=1 Tax=Nocardia sp. CA-151230 TaxID=3239982 RepID=UPI003D8DD628